MRLFTKSAIFLLFVVLMVPQTFAELCDGDLHVEFQFIAFDKDNIQRISDYQHSSHYKQFDILALKTLTLRNDANCTSSEKQISVNLRAPDGKIHSFFVAKIPEIQPYDLYSLTYQRHAPRQGEGYVYADSSNTEKSFHAITLEKPGFWNIKYNLESVNSSIDSGLSGDSMIDETGNPHDYLYVMDEKSVLAYENQGAVLGVTRMALWIAIMAIIVQIGLAIWQYLTQKHRRKHIQKDILESIRTFVKVIREDVEGHFKELNKTPEVIPSYYITSLPATFYITNLASYFKGKPTENLKKILVKTQHKIENINRVVELLQEAHIHGKKKVKVELLNELKAKDKKQREFKYHEHLKDLIMDVETELAELSGNNSSKQEKETSVETAAQKKIGAKTENSEVIRLTILSVMLAAVFGILHFWPEGKTLPGISMELVLHVISTVFYGPTLFLVLLFLALMGLRHSYRLHWEFNLHKWAYDFAMWLTSLTFLLTVSISTGIWVFTKLGVDSKYAGIIFVLIVMVLAILYSWYVLKAYLGDIPQRFNEKPPRKQKMKRK